MTNEFMPVSVEDEARAIYAAVIPFLNVQGQMALVEAFTNADAEQRTTQVIAAKAFLASVGA